MTSYIIRRVLLIVPTLILVTLLVFMIVRVIPGSVITLMVSERQMDSPLASGDQEFTTQVLRHALGLDVPIYVQYGRWVSGVVRGDLGLSLWARKSITDQMAEKIPVSFELGLMSAIVSLIIALPVGVYSAIRHNAWGDYVGRTIAVLAISLPSFWIATVVIVYPSIWFGWAPAMDYIPFSSDPLGNIVQFIVPAVIMGMALSGTLMRMTRTMMLEVLRQDYVRTAWSKGLTERVIVIRHALRNALLPVVTLLGMMVPMLVGGSVVLEQIFNLPGVGRWMVDAVNQRDYPIISGINLVLATLVLACNLLVDVAYSWLDPRIRYR